MQSSIIDFLLLAKNSKLKSDFFSLKWQQIENFLLPKSPVE